MRAQSQPASFGVVYRVSCKTSGKDYIGQTIQDVGRRFRRHAGDSRFALGAAIAKYGRSDFAVEVLESCDSAAELNAAESFWIDWYRSLAPRGYNLVTGGGSTHAGRKLSVEHVAKLRARLKGRQVSAETRERIRESLSGRSLTADHCMQLSAAWVDRRSRGPHVRGPFTDAHRAALRAAWAKRKANKAGAR